MNWNFELTSVEYQQHYVAYAGYSDELEPFLVGTGVVKIVNDFDDVVEVPFRFHLHRYHDDHEGEEFYGFRYHITTVGKMKLTKLKGWKQMREQIINGLWDLAIAMFETEDDLWSELWRYCADNGLDQVDLEELPDLNGYEPNRKANAERIQKLEYLSQHPNCLPF